jgi:hypothetical protein
MLTGKEFLRRIIDHHGGQERWQKINKLVIYARSSGMALPLRFKFKAFRDYAAEISTKEPRVIITPHPVHGNRGGFYKDTVWIESAAGQLLEKRERSRQAFGDLRHKLWWDNLDAMYFAGYALWNYLTTPFMLLQQGMQIDEIGKWQEGNEEWHRLRVLFPETVPTHCQEQIFYFDDEGQLRRHDYTAEVFGKWARAAHYCTAHRKYGGFLFPTHRTVYPRNKVGFANRSITLVHIEIDDIDIYLQDEE